MKKGGLRSIRLPPDFFSAIDIGTKVFLGFDP